MNSYTTTILILTLNAENDIENIFEKINFNKYKVIIIDSESDDDTIKVCQKYNCQIEVIRRRNFNHGATREYARKLTDSDIVVFLTQDAIPISEDSIDKLILPLIEGRASVSYARQLPKKGSSLFESFPREYNYGTESQIRSIDDIDQYGVYTFFSSDSCSAYINRDLDLIGGIKPTIMSEDYFNAAKLLSTGKKIAYVSEAQVIHSHRYSLTQEFKRMFDTGYSRALRPWVQELVGNTNKRGFEYSVALIKKLMFENPFLIPYALVQTIVKYIGYKVGFHSFKFPTWFKKIFSGQKYYWSSKYYVK